MNIIVPDAHANSFHIRLLKEGMYGRDYRYNYCLFQLITANSADVESVVRIWKEDFNGDCVVKDDCIICYHKLFNTTHSEYDVKTSIPFALEIGVPTCTLDTRLVPTVIGECASYINYNGKPYVDDVMTQVFYGEYIKTVRLPSHFNAGSLYSITDNPSKYIVTPFCIIAKNEQGTGNTVILTSTKFDTEDNSIYNLMKSGKLWKEVLIPLATEDFDTIRDYFEYPPKSVGIFQFAFRANEALHKEYLGLRKQREVNLNGINSHVKAIAELRSANVDLEKSIAQKRSDLRAGCTPRKLVSTINEVMNLPYVNDVELEDTTIKFYLDKIQVDNGPYLGPYEIEYDQVDKSIRITNEYPAYNGDEELAHPHCPNDSEPCWGNVSEVPYMLQIGEFAVAIELIHEFLATYNPEDVWGRRLIYWDAVYALLDMRDRDLLHLVDDEYEGQYFEVFGTHLFRETCEYCGHLEDDCTCERCEKCGERLGDCCCDRCEICGRLLDDGYYDCCECEKCKEDGHSLRCNECERCGGCSDE